MASPPTTVDREGDGWVLHEYGSVGSTNDTAAGLPVWNAVRSDTQTAGRGRYQRSWVSDAGGLWLSAVVPIGPPESGWAALPLAAGLAVCESLAVLGAIGLRLRWPNDVMVGHRKLAGLLVDQHRPGAAVVGVGVNVRNRPEAADAGLAGTVVRLSDLLDPVPGPRELARGILGRLRQVIEEMHRTGFAGLVPRVNGWWQTGMGVEIETEGARTRGVFHGVDSTGRLRVGTPAGTTQELAAHQVLRMRELTETNGDCR